MKNVFNSETKAEIQRRVQARALRSSFIMIAMMLALPILLSACGKSEWREVKAPETFAAAKPEVAPTVVPEAQPAQSPAPALTPPAPVVKAPTKRPAKNVIPVSALESAPAEPTAPSVQPAPVKSVPAVQVEPETKAPVAKTPAAKAPVAKVPVVKAPAKPLPKAPVAIVQTPITSESDRYVMIQNIATEKLRVYERSTVAGEPNRLVFETNLIAGENNPAATRRTALGSYKIEKWIKFYQDNAGLFPSWFDTTMPSMPLPGASLEDWTRRDLMPIVNGKPSGLVRGAFGWYTAKIGPNAFAQWTHGTVGWGADQDVFIEIPKTQLAQFYADPRSYGCTRVENRAIAFLQDLLPVGTRVLKVYAKETLADKTRARYKNQKNVPFEFALTKDEVRLENPNSSERAKQILRAVSEDSVLEVGSYNLDSTPDVVPFKKTAGTRNVVTMVNPLANLYDLPEKSFHGEFIVDEGRFVNYKHPSELRLGGYKELLPASVLK